MLPNSSWSPTLCFHLFGLYFGAYRFIIFMNYLCRLCFIKPGFDFEFHFAIYIILHGFIVVFFKSQFFFFFPHNPLYFGYRCVTVVDVLSIENIK